VIFCSGRFAVELQKKKLVNANGGADLKVFSALHISKALLVACLE